MFTQQHREINRCESVCRHRRHEERARLPRSVRHERGEGRGEGGLTSTYGLVVAERLLSPPLSSVPNGGEGAGSPALRQPERFLSAERGRQFSLSQRERAGVRENASLTPVALRSRRRRPFTLPEPEMHPCRADGNPPFVAAFAWHEIELRSRLVPAVIPA